MFALTKLAYLKVLQVIISFKIHYSIRLVFFHAKKFSPQNTPFCKELMGGFVENNVVLLPRGWLGLVEKATKYAVGKQYQEARWKKSITQRETPTAY